jgi:hypothetical protein
MYFQKRLHAALLALTERDAGYDTVKSGERDDGAVADWIGRENNEALC